MFTTSKVTIHYNKNNATAPLLFQIQTQIRMHRTKYFYRWY